MWRNYISDMVQNGGDEDPAHIENVLRGAKEQIDKFYKRPVGVYAQVKKFLSSTGSGDVWKEIGAKVFRQTRDEYAKNIENQERRREQKNEEVFEFDPLGIEQVISTLSNSTNSVDLVITLQLCCGARKIEILNDKVSLFEKKGEAVVVQKGCAKVPLDKPQKCICKALVVLNSDDFLEILKKVRSAVSAEKSQSFSTKITRRLRDIFPDVKITSHWLRAIYGAYVAYKQKNKSAPRAIQQALGHDLMTTAPSYMYVRVAEGGRRPNFQSLELVLEWSENVHS